MEQLFGLFGTSYMQWILILIAVDVVLGVIGALVKKEFQLGKVAGFMKRGIITYVLGFAILEIVAQMLPALAMFTTVAYFLILLALVGSILSNLGKFGLKVPSILTK